MGLHLFVPYAFVLRHIRILVQTGSYNTCKYQKRGGKTLRVILLPYLLYQLLFFPIEFFHDGGYRDFEVCLKLLCGILTGDGYTTPISMPVCLPCWFIVSIIQLRLLFLFVPVNKYTTSILTIFSCAFLLLRKYLGFDLYFCLDSTIMAIPYFLLGHYMGRYLGVIQNNYKLYCIGLLCAITVGVILFYNGDAQMNGPSFGKNLFLNYTAGCMGTFLVFAVSMILAIRFKTQLVIRDISRNTLFIIFSHWVLLLAVSVFAKKILLTLCSSNAAVILILSMVFTIGILWVSKLLIDKLMKTCPILLGKTKR